MSFSTGQIESLQAPLGRSEVKEREQGGRKVSYIEGWHAIAEANRIFGHDAWDREVVSCKETSRDLVELSGSKGPYKQWRVSYTMTVRVLVFAGADRVIKRDGTGYGSGMSKPEALGDAIESAIKEAETDAMKRALMTFGNPFGLALYDKTQANVVNDAPPEPKPVASAPARPRLGRGQEDMRDDNPFDDFPGDLPAKVIEPAVSSAAIAIGRELKACKTLAALATLWGSARVKEFIRATHNADRVSLNGAKEARKAALENNSDLMMTGA